MSLAADDSATLSGLCRLRHDWTRTEIGALFDLPFPELVFRAQSIHRQYFDPAEVQISTLLSIKTGGCPEDCAYCPQSARYDTGVNAEKLMALDAVLAEARAAKSAGASRFCMGAAWRSPKDRELEHVCEMVEAVKGLGLETCATLGMLTAAQARSLKRAGLDYYNHNLDTSPEFYGEIITIAAARITMPRSVVRLSAGREDMSEETQALCFLAGANSIFYGPKLLTTGNPERDRDRVLMDKLGLSPMQ